MESSGNRPYRIGAIYWRARAIEQMRDRAAALPLYRQVLAEAPRSYYGVLAARRLGGTTDVSIPASVTLPADPAEALAGDPGFMRVELLRRLGLIEAALDELDDVVERAIGDPVRLYGLSSAYVRDERYHLALRIHPPPLRPTSPPAAIPRCRAPSGRLLYPFAWRSDVMAAAARAGIEPYLVAAVVREESSYYPRAVSRAGARGLMQLMPATARPMAEHRGLAFAGGDLLDDPRANIEMGTAFLGGLMKEFSDPRLALAAYNAGPTRVRGWWQSRRRATSRRGSSRFPSTRLASTSSA